MKLAGLIARWKCLYLGVHLIIKLASVSQKLRMSQVSLLDSKIRDVPGHDMRAQIYTTDMVLFIITLETKKLKMKETLCTELDPTLIRSMFTKVYLWSFN